MLNIFVLEFIERSVGKKMPVILADISGISERTLRKPIFSKKTSSKVEEGLKKRMKSIKIDGFSELETREFIQKAPESLCARFIYKYQIPMDFPRTFEYAKKIDNISLHLFEAWESNDLEEFKNILLVSEFHKSEYYMSSDDESVSLNTLESITSSQSWKEINEPFRILAFNILLSLMAYWDIEFYCYHFLTFKPQSLFSMVLPRLDPSIKINDGQKK